MTNGNEQSLYEDKLSVFLDNSHEVKTDVGSLDGKIDKDGSNVRENKKNDGSVNNDSDCHINFSSDEHEDEELSNSFLSTY